MRLDGSRDPHKKPFPLSMSASVGSPRGTPELLSKGLPLIASHRTHKTPLSLPSATSAVGTTLNLTASPRNSPRGKPSGPIHLESVDPIIKDGKTDEIDESVMNVKLMAKTLRSGNEDQITLVLFETQHILEVCREYAVQTLLPIICEEVVGWTQSLQVSAAEALLIVVATTVPPTLAKSLSDTAFQLIRSAKDQVISETWGQILVRTLPHVSWTAKELDEVVDQLEHQGHNGADGKLVVSRQLTARILGSLAVCSKEEELKRRIMYRAIYITNDKNVEVRGMIAESMQFIAASINVKVVEDELWPCIKRLITDDNARVHAVSLRSLSYIATAHKEQNPRTKLFRDLIPSIFTMECIKIRRDAETDQRRLEDDKYLVLEINSEIFGALLHSCWEFLTEDSALKDAFKAYLAMATCNSPAVRKYCAFNLPGVSHCFLRKYRTEMAGIAEFLSKDTDPEARWILAGGIHEVVKLLANPDTIAKLYNAVLALLQDENPLVRMNTLKHFEKLIAQLAKHMGYTAVGKLEPIFHDLHLLSEGNWRTQELLSKQLLLAAPLVPPPCIRSHVLPLLFKMAESSSYLVRKAAMAAVATCMRYIPDTTERDEEMASFRKEWAKGSIYWMRIGFIDSAQAAVNLYSRCIFRDTFGSALLRLATDRVSNVRARVALILPEVAPACHQMVEFQAALMSLKKDTDRDVVYSMRDIDNSIAVSLEKGTKDFENDMQREEEEQELYSKHLQAQKEAFRKKKGTVKRAKTLAMLMTKPMKVHTSQQKASHVAERSGDLESSKAGNDLGKQLSRHLGKKQSMLKSEASPVAGASQHSNSKEKKSHGRKSRVLFDHDSPSSSHDKGGGNITPSTPSPMKETYWRLSKQLGKKSSMAKSDIAPIAATSQHSNSKERKSRGRKSRLGSAPEGANSSHDK